MSGTATRNPYLGELVKQELRERFNRAVDENPREVFMVMSYLLIGTELRVGCTESETHANNPNVVKDYLVGFEAETRAAEKLICSEDEQDSIDSEVCRWETEFLQDVLSFTDMARIELDS